MIRLRVIGLRRGESFTRVCKATGGATVTALYDVDAARHLMASHPSYDIRRAKPALEPAVNQGD